MECRSFSLSSSSLESGRSDAVSESKDVTEIFGKSGMTSSKEDGPPIEFSDANSEYVEDDWLNNEVCNDVLSCAASHST